MLCFDRLELPRLPRGWRLAIDAVAIGLILLVVPDLVVVRPEAVVGNPMEAIETAVVQGHQNYLLGPANEILHGRAMLVDTASQYGVGSIYFLAGWFELAPIGYGTMSLLSAALSAMVFAGAYLVLRMAGVYRLLAGAALAVAVLALVFNTTYPIDEVPQDSAFRLGLPMGVLVALVAAERWPRYQRAASLAAFAISGVAAIWSLEGFVYTLTVFAAMTCMRAWLRPAGSRAPWVRGQALGIVVASLTAHLLLAAITLAATGQLPDWGQYIAYLREFL